jgi:hypothetical protein
MKRLLSAATVATMLLVVCPAFADSPTTVLNAVQNQGNTSGQAAVGTSGNTNQNNNQNSLGTSSATAVNIGGINITPSTTGGGVSGLNAAESGTGTGEGYVGYSGSTTFASPSITFGSSNVKNINVNLPGLPGLLGSPGNFSQPYKPDVFINGAGPIRPARMTYEQAQECRGGYGYKDTYVGANREKAKEIQLVYAAWDKIDISNDISNYVGISSVEGADKPWLPAVCEAAYHAMDRGANYGVVEFIIRPKNTMKGFGFGTSGGGSVVPSVATATSPYGLAASLGFGLGWSSQRVEGEVMIQVTGLRVPTQTAAVKPAVPTAPVSAPPPPAATMTPAPAAPVSPPLPAEAPRVIKPDGQTLKLQPEGRPQSGPDVLQSDPQPLSVPGQPQGAQDQPVSIVPDQSPVPLSVPGQPSASAAPQAAPAPSPAPLPAPVPQTPTPLNVPGQPSASTVPQVGPSQSPAPAQTPLSVPGQPAAFAPQQGNSTAPIPASFLAPTGQPQGIQSKINGAGGR